MTYEHYSDDGTSFADGTETVTSPLDTIAPTTWRAHIAISGAHHGSLDANVSWNGPTGTTGQVTSTLDGTTLTGPRPDGACPARLPQAPPLHVAVGPGLRVTVTASIPGAGIDEQESDTRPVEGAVVTAGGAEGVTDVEGSVVLAGVAAPVLVRATAGDTFAPAAVVAP